MSREDSKRARHRQRQARYEARVRAGVGLYPVPLEAIDIDTLIALQWLSEGSEVDRALVGKRIAALVRSLRDAKFFLTRQAR